MCHSKELIFLYSAYTDRLILFYDIDNSYIIKTLRGDAHAAIRKIEGRMDMKKLRNCSILCCFTIAACGLGKSREADKLYINHRLIFEILLNNDCKVEAKKKGLVTVVLPVGSPDSVSYTHLDVYKRQSLVTEAVLVSASEIPERTVPRSRNV